MKVKAWQIAVIVLGLVVGGWLLVRAIRGNEVDLPNTMYLVDVETGALYKYHLEYGRSMVLPARRPDTGQIALLRVVDENGVWTVTPRDLHLLSQLDKGVEPKAIDTESGKLTVKAGSPSSYTPPKLK